jgi:hypothetical protein
MFDNDQDIRAEALKRAIEFQGGEVQSATSVVATARSFHLFLVGVKEEHQDS